MLPKCATAKQRQMFAYAVAHPYSLLAADPRTGKTMVAIYLRKKRNCNALVVCPAYLVPNWKKEIHKWDKKASVTTFTAGKQIYEVCDSDFVVISFDLVQKAEHLFEWADMVIADEIHNLSHMTALRSQFFHRALYENAPKYFHGLTGTPIKNRVKEFYSLMALVYYDPRTDEGSGDMESAESFGEFLEKNVSKTKFFLQAFPDEITFAEYFSHSESHEVQVKGGRYITITNYFGLKNRKELKSWLKGKYIRIRATEKDLPPLTFLETTVRDIADPKLLAAFEAYFISDEEARAGATSFNHARSRRTSAVLPEHKRNAAVQKVPFTIKYVEDLMQSASCCLVYSDHKEPCERIAKHFGVPAITGSMPGAKRARLVADFQSGKLKVLCATVGALKEGADLYRARDLVLNDLPWVTGDIDQVCARTRKIGEKDPRTIHLIFGSPQDEKIWRVLNEKRETINQAT